MRGVSILDRERKGGVLGNFGVLDIGLLLGEVDLKCVGLFFVLMEDL